MRAEFVVKLGGSLLSDMTKARAFVQRFDLVGEPCVFTVGSGPLGDAFNNYTAANGIDLSFAASVESWSHIQSVNARLIASLDDTICVCASVNEVWTTIAAGRKPIVDASAFATHFMVLAREHQMSDVRSALIADLLGCSKLVVFTDVEGIFSADPRTDVTAAKIPLLSTADPLLRSRTSVDEGLPYLLDAKQIVAFVAGVDSFLRSEQTFAAYLASHASLIRPNVAPL